MNPVNSERGNVRLWYVFIAHAPFPPPDATFRPGEHLVVRCIDDSKTLGDLKSFIVAELPRQPGVQRGAPEMQPISPRNLSVPLPAISNEEAPVKIYPYESDPRNSLFRSVRYGVLELLLQLRSFDQVATAAWPALPAQSNAPRQAMSRNAAHVFAQELRDYATPAHVSALDVHQHKAQRFPPHQPCSAWVRISHPDCALFPLLATNCFTFARRVALVGILYSLKAAWDECGLT